jgi:hypothetical protein
MTRIGALAAVIVVALAAAGAALPTTPGANGLIVYAEEVNGRSQLFTIRPDGSEAKRITNVLGAWNPDWAPNGRSIVFELESQNSAAITVRGNRRSRPTVGGSSTSARQVVRAETLRATRPPGRQARGRVIYQRTRVDADAA